MSCELREVDELAPRTISVMTVKADHDLVVVDKVGIRKAADDLRELVDDLEEARARLEGSASSAKDLLAKLDDLTDALPDEGVDLLVESGHVEADRVDVPEVEVDVPDDVLRVLHREGLITTNDLLNFSLSQLFELLTEL